MGQGVDTRGQYSHIVKMYKILEKNLNDISPHNSQFFSLF